VNCLTLRSRQIAVIAERAPKTTATRLVDRADDLAAYCAGW
jgi:hypothetical protein